ncbi:hypothetical protein D3C87_755200 [compost metagenome]
MSAFDMKPKFNDLESYLAWRKSWKMLYADVSEKIRKMKRELKVLQRSGHDHHVAELQNKLRQERAMGAKAMTLLNEAKIRMSNITAMKRGIAEQHATFPVTIENVRNMDFHFNKKHLEFPDIVPMWILKAKGTSYYVHHVDCQTPWTTRETPDNPSTKGSIRIKRGDIHIDADGNATIS